MKKEKGKRGRGERGKKESDEEKETFFLFKTFKNSTPLTRVNPKLLDQLQVGRHRHHVLGDGLRPQLGGQPRPHGPRVEHRLDGRERLGDDDDEGGLRGEAVERAGDVDRVHVGEEAKLAPRGELGGLLVGAQGRVHEQRAQEGPADADHDDRRQRLARRALPLARAHLLREGLDFVQNLPDFRHDVLAVRDELGPSGRASGDVEHRAVLGRVDVLSRKHRVDLGLQARPLGQLQEEPLRALGLALPGEVEEDAVVLVEEGVAALLVEEEVLKVAVAFFFYLMISWGSRGFEKRERKRRVGARGSDDEREKKKRKKSSNRTHVLSISATCSLSACHSAVSAIVV